MVRPNYSCISKLFLVLPLAFFCFLAKPLAAQSGDSAQKVHPPAKACPPNPSPDALRMLAQDCAAGLERDANCRAYAKDETGEYVIVRDCSPKKPEVYLIIPVKHITGMDDSQVFSPAVAGLWEDAWLWSRKYPGEPPARTALAINSKSGRSQNQLHIHISCVLPEVSKTLESADIPFYPARAVSLELGPGKNTYMAVKITNLESENSPFKIIQAMPGISNDMKDQSIAVVGSKKAGEYYVLNTSVGGTNRGHAEELLEQTCALNQ